MDKQKSKAGAGKPRVGLRGRGARVALLWGMALTGAAFAQSPDAKTTKTSDGQASPTPSGSPPAVSQAGQAPSESAQNTANRSNQANQSDQTDPADRANPGQGGAGEQPQMQRSQQENQGNQQQSQQGTQPDNTARNKADQPTAEDQGSSPQDREMTQKIRRELVQSNDLSTTAKNVKIITENGKVTIRGPVNSEQEKEAIKAIAEKAAGQGNVTDQLEPKNR